MSASLARTQILLALLAAASSVLGAQSAPQITVDWNTTVAVSRTVPTLQVVVNPPLRPGQPLSTPAFAALQALGADYVRYVPWIPYPKLAVAELDPPTPQHTSWDFSLIDPTTKAFLDSTAGHPTVMNFSTAPAWMFKTDQPVAYPADPSEVTWSYTQGTELRDPSGKELADYYARLVSWYVNGGFTDENGVRHASGYHYSLPVWEVFNEPEYEHQPTPQQYTARYDAIVSAIHAVSPQTKFMGLALAEPSVRPETFEYFLDPAHHQPGTPIDYISYHFYAVPTADQSIDDWQYTFFDQANVFLTAVRYIESIRKRLSPHTKTDADELGSIVPEPPGNAVQALPQGYWNLSAALYAYLYIELAKLQIDIAGESQLVGYPSQFPSVSMMDWTTNKPNARFWALKLLKDAFHPGDTLVATSIAGSSDLAAQAFVTPAGRRLLLINKRNRALDVQLPDADRASALTVDESSDENPARSIKPSAGRLRLEPFAVTVVSW